MSAERSRGAGYRLRSMRWSDVQDPKAFSDYMESVDQRLREREVAIAARPFEAAAIVSKELRIKFTVPGRVWDRINGWFEQRYGARLLMDMSIGTMVVAVRGDPYAVRFPLTFGTVAINPFSLVQDAAPGLFEGLDHRALTELANTIEAGLRAVLALAERRLRPPPDLVSAVAHLLAQPAQGGMSKWSSQQGLEKMLNGFIEAHGASSKVKRRRGGAHDLLPLVELAERLGLPALDRDLVARVECTADVRYDRLPVAVAEAVAANQASVQLCGYVAKAWPQPLARTHGPGRPGAPP